MARSSSCRPEQDAELFWATIGGMGLTGVILDVTIDLIPIETSRCAVDTDRAPDLDALLGLMEDGDRYYRYSVAWIDLMARGRRLGRSVLTRGEHADVSQLRPRDAVDPLAYEPRQLLAVPPVVPARGVVSHLTMAAFNEMWFRKAPGAGWRRSCRSRGTSTRWTSSAPGTGCTAAVASCSTSSSCRSARRRRCGGSSSVLAASGTASFLAVLKRFGPANPAPLSFPRPGWALALDIPASAPALASLLHGLDELVLEAGGRHYLAKDACTTPAAIRRGYPRLAEWRAVRDAADPSGVWASDQSRRLGLVGGLTCNMNPSPSTSERAPGSGEAASDRAPGRERLSAACVAGERSRACVAGERSNAERPWGGADHRPARRRQRDRAGHRRGAGVAVDAEWSCWRRAVRTRCRQARCSGMA